VIAWTRSIKVVFIGAARFRPMVRAESRLLRMWLPPSIPLAVLIRCLVPTKGYTNFPFRHDIDFQRRSALWRGDVFASHDFQSVLAAMSKSAAMKGEQLMTWKASLRSLAILCAA
jgi:hypothetical protein